MIQFFKFQTCLGLCFSSSFKGKKQAMEVSIDSRLREAARTGNVSNLYALIQEDPFILERIDQIPFVETPFHIAAVEGQIKFAMEMMNLKPSLAKKLNPDGFSPMHLALINGHTNLVLRLLKADKDLVRVKGREGMTPLHGVVTMGGSNFLYEFLEACPECIEDVTVQGETALHLALKSDQMEAFKLLIGWLQRKRRGIAHDRKRKIVNWRDDRDNTVLHVAARKEQTQVLKLLLGSFIWLDVKAKNSDGLTAQEILQNAEGQPMNSSEKDTKIKHLKKKVDCFQSILVLTSRAKDSLSMEMINALLVITALVITATYQSSLSPPGGLWQGDNSSTANINTLNVTTTTLHHHHLIAAAHGGEYDVIHFMKGFFGNESRKAGTTVMSPDSYTWFWVLNSSTLVSSILLTLLLFLSAPLLLFHLSPLYYLLVNYFYSMKILSPSTTWSNINLAFCLFFYFLPFLLPLFISVCLWRMKHKIMEIMDRTDFLSACGADIVCILDAMIKSVLLIIDFLF